NPMDAVRPLARPGEARTDLWKTLLLLALMLLIADVAVRRVVIPFSEMMQRVRAWWAGQTAKNAQKSQTQTERAVRLRGAKDRVAKAPVIRTQQATPSSPAAFDLDPNGA